MWDYDKLFAEGNVVGIKVLSSNKIYKYVVDNRSIGNNDFWSYYKNNTLSDKDDNDFEIQYIIRLNEYGDIVEKLFDRDRDMMEPMPKLEDGMFVRCYSPYRNESSLGLIYNNRVIYQNGEWDEVYDLTKETIMEVYSDKALCFNSCQESYLLWRNPKYQPN